MTVNTVQSQLIKYNLQVLTGVQWDFHAQAEGEHKFFTWLLVQSKLLTADKLLASNWPCNPICPLCNVEKTSVHLILRCQFARVVLEKIGVWAGGLVQAQIIMQSFFLRDQNAEMEDWWKMELANLPKQVRRTKAAILMYTAWNICKARKRWIFEGVKMDAVQDEIKAEIVLTRLACGGPVIP